MDLTDEQVLAELRKDELRVWHAPVTTVGGRHLQTVFRNTFTRLALARIEAREAAARERGACLRDVDAEPELPDDPPAAMVERLARATKDEWMEILRVVVRTTKREIAARISARGGVA